MGEPGLIALKRMLGRAEVTAGPASGPTDGFGRVGAISLRTSDWLMLLACRAKGSDGAAPFH
ncbi:MAG: hypothetical protein HIU92_13730 [Proteobacteria bacterium]|nr:hypothetical protein [Pseudomonadota bacterium]